jgi:hypothetical protein
MHRRPAFDLIAVLIASLALIALSVLSLVIVPGSRGLQGVTAGVIGTVVCVCALWLRRGRGRK